MAEPIWLDRVSRATFIADNLYHTCVSPDDGQRLRESGVISPAGTLKSRKAREAFAWAGNVKTEAHKYFTKAACRDAVKRLLKMPRVEIPLLPGYPLEFWIEQQASAVQHFCQRTRKNVGSSLRFRTDRQMCSMDWEETLPMEVPNLRHSASC